MMGRLREQRRVRNAALDHHQTQNAQVLAFELVETNFLGPLRLSRRERLKAFPIVTLYPRPLLCFAKSSLASDF